MTTFARVTPTLSDLLWKLPAGAQRLHEWLLQNTRSGQPYEAFLEKFTARSGYSLRHAQRSLDVLLNADIVEVVQRHSGKIYTLIVHDDRTFDFEKGAKKSSISASMSKVSAPMSKIEGSKADSVVTNNRDSFKENRDTHPNHPVKTVEPGSNTVTSDHPKTDTVSNGLHQELENTLQQPLNKNILAVLIEYSEFRARDALDALREAMGTGNVKNPAGWFISALRKGYKPNHACCSQPQLVKAPEPDKSEVPDGFKLWLEWAIKAGVAIASGHHDGELMVYGKDSAEPFEQAQQTWPLEKLQEMVQQPSSAPIQAKETLPDMPVPSAQAVEDERQRQNALARLKAKFALPLLKTQAIQEARLWGFEVTGAGIFEVAF